MPKDIISKVKKLREETELSIMDIKKALEEAKGDEKSAKQILKAKGLKSVAKRAEKETKQGLVASYTHNNGKIGVLVELLCETDFVARGDDFVQLSRDLCLQVAAMGKKDLEKQDFIKDSSKKIGDLIKELIAKLGENIKLGRVERFEI